MDKQTDALEIATSVANLDPHDRVGALNGIVKADFGTEPAEDETGNPFKQSIFDGFTVLMPYSKASDKVEVLQEAARHIRDYAEIDGDGWLAQDLNDFSQQIVTTFTDETETEPAEG